MLKLNDTFPRKREYLVYDTNLGERWSEVYFAWSTSYISNRQKLCVYVCVYVCMYVRKNWANGF